jgi:hypothetical protein
MAMTSKQLLKSDKSQIKSKNIPGLLSDLHKEPK